MKYIIIILIASLIWTCKVSPDTEKLTDGNANDTIKFQYKGFNTGINLNLLTDNKFIYRDYSYGCTGGGENEIVYGKYSINNNKLTLNPDSIKFEYLPFNTFNKPLIFNLKYGIDSLKIKTKYDIINWNKTKYLLSEEPDSLFRNWYILTTNNFKDYIDTKRQWNDYYEFADFYNSGYEPKSHGRYLTQNFEVKNDSTFDNLDLNEINIKWRNLFLRRPITAKITKVTKNLSEDNVIESFLVEIDKGRKDGVIAGLTVLSRENLDDYIEIVEVHNEKSIGFCYLNENKYGVGDIVKTK